MAVSAKRRVKILFAGLVLVAGGLLLHRVAGSTDGAVSRYARALVAPATLEYAANLATLAGTVIAVVVGIWTLILTQQSNRRDVSARTRPRADFPFEVYGANDLAELMTTRVGTDAAGVSYVARLSPERQRAFEQRLVAHRFILLTGRTGLGKTREALEAIRRLAQESAEDVTVLYPRDDVDFQGELPTDIPTRHVVLFVDDIHQRYEASPTSHHRHGVDTPSFHDRFTATVSSLQRRLGGSDFRVIVTARDEPDLLQHMKLDTPFWRRFHRYQLPAVFGERSIVFADEISRGLGVELDDGARHYIAGKTDGTPAGIFTALARETRRRNSTTPITEADLKGYSFKYPADWDNRIYKELIAPVARRRCVFEAVGILRTLRMGTQIDLVEDLAARQWGRSFLSVRRALIRRSIRRELRTWMFVYQGRVCCPDSYTVGKASAQDALVRVAACVKRALNDRTIARHIAEESIVNLSFSLVEQFQRGPMAVELLDEASRTLPDKGKLLSALSGIQNLLGKHRAALQAAKAAVEYHASSQSLTVLSYAHTWVGDDDRAISAARRATEAADADWESWLSLGVLLSKQDVHLEAVTALRRSCELNPENAKARSSLGVALERSGNITEGIAECQEATELDPHDPVAWRNLGIALDRQGKGPEAVSALEMALRLDPDDFRSGIALVWSHVHHGGMDGGHAILTQLIARGSANKRNQYLLSVGLGMMGRHEEAVSAAKASLALDSTYREARRSAAINLGNLGRHAEAVEIMSVIPREERDTEDWTNLAWAFFRGQRLDQALEAVTTARRLAPHHPEPARIQSRILYTLGRVAEAKETLEGIPVDARTADDWYHLSTCFSRLQQHEPSRAHAEQALRVDPNHMGALRCLSTALANLNRMDEVIDVLERLPADQRSADDWYHVSVGYGRARQYEKALAAAAEALKEEPLHRGALRSLSVNLSLLGRHNEGIETLRRIPETARTAQDWYYLSVAFGKAGLSRDAVAAADTALSIEPGHRGAQESRSRNRDMTESGEPSPDNPEWPKYWSREYQEGNRTPAFLTRGLHWLGTAESNEYWSSVFRRLWQEDFHRAELAELGSRWLSNYPLGRKADDVRRALGIEELPRSETSLAPRAHNPNLTEVGRAALNRLAPNQVFEGTVVRVLAYGAFVGNGQIAGLLHRSRWPTGQEYEVGARMWVQVTHIDAENGRISLALAPPPRSAKADS